MSYKTILLHIDESSRLTERIGLAAALALQQHSHLICVAMTGVSRFLYHNELVDEQDPHLALHLNYLRDKARGLLHDCGPRLEQLGLRNVEQHVVDDDAGAGLSQQARCADLVVIGQADPQRANPVLLGDLAGHVVIHAGRPVLIVPHAATPAAVPGRILIAWDGGKEAARAVTAALPLLQGAQRVHVAIFDPELNGMAHGEPPGTDLARYLARHGVGCEVVLRQSTKPGLFMAAPPVGPALLTMAADLSCDLLVLGAYGHSRLRETLLGGVTRSVLETATLPVLMAH